MIVIFVKIFSQPCRDKQHLIVGVNTEMIQSFSISHLSLTLAAFLSYIHYTDKTWKRTELIMR